MASEVLVETTENNPPSNIDDLKPKMKLTGRVTRIDLYGAFVDIGIGQDALIHISKIKKGSVSRVSDVLTVDESVDVFVDKVDAKTNRVSLTMIKPLDVTWNDLKKGQQYSGTITRMEQYGVFVDIGAERPGLVHVSELADTFVKHPNELYSVDQAIDVRVVDYDRRKRRIDLTVAHEDDLEIADEDEVEEAPTAMEMAIRKAFEDSGSAIPLKKRQTRRSRRNRHAQEDLLARTLRTRKS